ncbi:hypothetical protein [Streptomyces sp. 16-176A]|uniref:hypothetical protein n=1 Tax=Streptomyces sp. 16-176A TaxID=2530458 RepID=UPI00345D3967
MHPEPDTSAVESRTAAGAANRAAVARGRRRRRRAGDAVGPVFVDASGRRSKVLRRIGLLVGCACLTYALVLGAAFMGWGTSLNPSSLLPFGGGRGGDRGGAGVPGGRPPQDGTGRQAVLPGGAAPTAHPSGTPTTLPTAVPSGAPTAPSDGTSAPTARTTAPTATARTTAPTTAAAVAD